MVVHLAGLVCEPLDGDLLLYVQPIRESDFRTVTHGLQILESSIKPSTKTIKSSILYEAQLANFI